MPVTTITTKTRVRIGKDPVPPRPMTVEEYARFEEPEDGYRYELVRGILTVQEPGPGYPHAFLQADLVRHLGNWTRRTGCGKIAVEMDCIICMTPATVRRPDISVFLEPRYWGTTSGNWAQGAPEIAIEILSPSNTPGAMREKMRDYFDADALRVWMVDPKTRTVTIHRADGSETIFRDGERLEDPDVLPGFVLEVEELFGK